MYSHNTHLYIKRTAILLSLLTGRIEAVYGRTILHRLFASRRRWPTHEGVPCPVAVQTYVLGWNIVKLFNKRWLYIICGDLVHCLVHTITDRLTWWLTAMGLSSPLLNSVCVCVCVCGVRWKHTRCAQLCDVQTPLNYSVIVVRKKRSHYGNCVKSLLNWIVIDIAYAIFAWCEKWCQHI